MYKKIIIFIIIILGIFLRFKLEDLRYDKLQENQKISGIFYVKSFKEEKEYKNKYKIKYEGNYYFIYLNKKIDLSYGDIAQFTGNFKNFQGQRNFGGFNYKEYEKQEKISGIIEIEEFNIVGQKKDFLFYIYKFRNSLKEIIYKKYEGKEASFLCGILLGENKEADEEVVNDFRDASLSHVLAISGMHVTYVVVGMRFLISEIINARRKQNYLLIGFIIIFSIFVGGSASCLRACIMAILAIVAELTFREVDFIRSLLFSFIILFIINPYNLFNVGMWLSFLATFGLGKARISYVERLKIPKIIKQSIYANILIIPLIWHVFHIISLSFLVSNFLIRIFNCSNFNNWIFFHIYPIFKHFRKPTN